MPIRTFFVFAALLLLAGACHADGEIDWRHSITQDAVTLTANPLTPVQRTAFYLARGFSATGILPYAHACGFSVGMHNRRGGAIRTALADWRAVAPDGRRVRLRLPGEWDAEWVRDAVPEPARIAFRWAQFQAENVFDAGDWIMGMTTLEQPLPDGFNLVASYHDGKERHEIILDGLSCARNSGAD